MKRHTVKCLRLCETKYNLLCSLHFLLICLTFNVNEITHSFCVCVGTHRNEDV